MALTTLLSPSPKKSSSAQLLNSSSNGSKTQVIQRSMSSLLKPSFESASSPQLGAIKLFAGRRLFSTKTVVPDLQIRCTATGA